MGGGWVVDGWWTRPDEYLIQIVEQIGHRVPYWCYFIESQHLESGNSQWVGSRGQSAPLHFH